MFWEKFLKSFLCQPPRKALIITGRERGYFIFSCQPPCQPLAPSTDHRKEKKVSHHVSHQPPSTYHQKRGYFHVSHPCQPLAPSTYYYRKEERLFYLFMSDTPPCQPSTTYSKIYRLPLSLGQPPAICAIQWTLSFTPHAEHDHPIPKTVLFQL